MIWDCSNFLIFKRNADFFIFNKCTSYLYTVDQLHYDIACLAKKKTTVFDLQTIVRLFPEHSLRSVSSHFNDVVKIFSKDADYKCSSQRYSLKDIMHSISIVPQIVIEVTEQCNLRCKYCYYGKMYHNDGVRNSIMNVDNCVLVLRELLSVRHVLYNRIVISFYGGEPLLNFNLIRTVVMLCKNEFPDLEYTFSITTNGTLLLKHIDFLERYNFKVLISLDGSEDDNINRIYKNFLPTFNRLNRIVEYLSYGHSEFFRRNISFISVLHSRSNIISICKYFLKFNKTPILTTLSLEDINEKQQTVYPYQGVATNEMSQLYDLNRDVYRTIKGATKSYTSANMENKISVIPRRNPLRGCELFANKIFLAVNEKVYLCEKSSRSFPFGDFKDGKLSFFMDFINDYYKVFNESLNTVCSDCSIRVLCKKCFFSEPSLINCSTSCKLSNSQLINNINSDLNDT